jgi:hypothetical protein
MSSLESVRALIQQLSANKDADVANYARCLAGFIETGDLVWLGRVGAPPAHGKIGDIGRLAAAEVWPWSEETRRVVEFGARLYHTRPPTGWPSFRVYFEDVLQVVFRREENGDSSPADWLWSKVVGLGFDAAALVEALSDGLWGSAFAAWGAEDDRARFEHLWERRLLEYASDELILMLGSKRHGYLLHTLAKVRREVVSEWLRRTASPAGAPSVEQIQALVAGAEEFDPLAEAFVTSGAPHLDRAVILEALMARRSDKHRELFLSVVKDPGLASAPEILGRWCDLAPDDALVALPKLFGTGMALTHGLMSAPGYLKAYALAAGRLAEGGAAVAEAIISSGPLDAKREMIHALLQPSVAERAGDVASWVRKIALSAKTTEEKVVVYRTMCVCRPGWFVPEWKELLAATSKQLREIAVNALTAWDREEAAKIAGDYLTAKKNDQRLGATALCAELGGGAAITALQAAFAAEKSAAVRSEMRRALDLLGAALAAAGVPASETKSAASCTLGEWEAALAAQKRPPKAPATEWLEMAALPALPGKDGSVVGPLTLAHVFSTQAARKEVAESVKVDFPITDLGDGEASIGMTQTPVPGQRSIQIAPDLLPVFAQIARSCSGDFALALLNTWLGSEQEAKHRWALTIAGELGDTRILSVLNSWIPKWCEAGRGKLAEYAAQAIALQGSDEALMLLDALATRYRSKQRNIGAAAAQAFQAAADARGLSADELGDLVVPSFGFNEDGVRDFVWDGGAARAELGVDLKLTWSDPESEKGLKGLPALAPDALKAEAKQLGKLLREAAKSQTARLELSLVRQRRWPVARWRGLYERHPVLRAFATRLVWGVYGADGDLLRCFRRYPNGLLADAGGGLEELPETDTQIGMVHPLELAPEMIAAWRAHLARFKVEPPFPQLDRAVERLEPLHANRRELAVAQGKELGAGTFRSRAERRGWQRGSVVDAGGVAGYFKSFPGAGVEVTIETEGLYIGIDPMETVTLGVARFVRADSVKRGSYVYDDPQAGDERVMNFGSVPPVVYSETVGDLKAIAGIVAADGGEEADPA